MKTMVRLGLILISMLLLACTSETPPAGLSVDEQTDEQIEQVEQVEITATDTEEPAQLGLLGSVRRETDTVEHGISADALEQVIDEANFLAGDVLRVRDGGEGLLDFADGMLLRLFNDTEMNVVAVESDPGSPIDVRMFLEEGGFTGKLTAEGGHALFETPGGAEITVLGTEFFVVYDSANQLTVVGNFNGQVEVSGAGSSIILMDNHFVEVVDGQAPGPQIPFSLNMPDLEERARDRQSAVNVAGDLTPSLWTVEMTYEHESFNEVRGAYTLTGTWTGEFEVSGNGQISGQGEAVFTHFLECGPGSGVGETLTGNFPFQIVGELTGKSNAYSSLTLNFIAGEASTESERASFCFMIDEGVADLVEFMKGLGNDLEVDAHDGATASYSVPFALFEGPSSGEIAVQMLDDE